MKRSKKPEAPVGKAAVPRKKGEAPAGVAPPLKPPREPAGSARQALEGLLMRNPKWASLKKTNPAIYNQKLEAMMADPDRFGLGL